MPPSAHKDLYRLGGRILSSSAKRQNFGCDCSNFVILMLHYSSLLYFILPRRLRMRPWVHASPARSYCADGGSASSHFCPSPWWARVKKKMIRVHFCLLICLAECNSTCHFGLTKNLACPSSCELWSVNFHLHFQPGISLRKPARERLVSDS